MRMSSIFSPWRWLDTASRAFQRERVRAAWVLAEWVLFRMGGGVQCSALGDDFAEVERRRFFALGDWLLWPSALATVAPSGTRLGCGRGRATLAGGIA